MKLKNLINQKIFNLKTKGSDRFYILSNFKKQKGLEAFTSILLNRSLLKTNFNAFNKKSIKNNVRYDYKNTGLFDLKRSFLYARYENYHFFKRNMSLKFCLQQALLINRLMVVLRLFFFFRFFRN